MKPAMVARNDSSINLITTPILLPELAVMAPLGPTHIPDNHGTAVTGIIGAAANGAGVVVDDSDLVGCRVHGFINDRFIGRPTAAINQVTSRGADVVMAHED